MRYDRLRDFINVQNMNIDGTDLQKLFHTAI